MIFRQLFDRDTCTYTYLLADEATREAVLIDPVRELVERDVGLLGELGLKLMATIETHMHADHVTGAWGLKQATGCDIVYPAASKLDADRLVGAGDTIAFGQHALEVRPTPGHTATCTSYLVDDMVFTGDALFIRGCGRTDFQGGSAETLYASVWEQLLSLPDATRVFPGHDYKGRTMTTVAEEKAHNPRLGAGKTVEQFAAIMDALGLPYPRYIDQALPGNRRLGRPAHSETGWWSKLPRSEAGARRIGLDFVKQAPGGVRMIDVREPHETAEGHVAGAELIPLGTLPQQAPGWNRDDAIVTICRSAGRSDRAALHLESMGFTKVASMSGGMLGWS
ncbi:MAG: MBL fold metallo-hydrolase [Proteobacteria bacterium]|nr:MBL fold metallo-hydrolase [Pseudomonadota bacterium]MCP4919918.1 MBL fold metallo-hydrolase [Pseudomonadota bacterium]